MRAAELLDSTDRLMPIISGIQKRWAALRAIEARPFNDRALRKSDKLHVEIAVLERLAERESAAGFWMSG